MARTRARSLGSALLASNPSGKRQVSSLASANTRQTSHVILIPNVSPAARASRNTRGSSICMASWTGSLNASSRRMRIARRAAATWARFPLRMMGEIRCLAQSGSRGAMASMIRARKAGVALQLTNILRDLKEDADADRGQPPQFRHGTALGRCKARPSAARVAGSAAANASMTLSW